MAGFGGSWELWVVFAYFKIDETIFAIVLLDCFRVFVLALRRFVVGSFLFRTGNTLLSDIEMSSWRIIALELSFDHRDLTLCLPNGVFEFVLQFISRFHNLIQFVLYIFYLSLVGRHEITNASWVGWQWVTVVLEITFASWVLLVRNFFKAEAEIVNLGFLVNFDLNSIQRKDGVVVSWVEFSTLTIRWSKAHFLSSFRHHTLTAAIENLSKIWVQVQIIWALALIKHIWIRVSALDNGLVSLKKI